MIKYLVLLLLLIPAVFANEEYFTSSELVIQQQISTSFSVTNPQQLEWVEARMSFVPENSYRQTVISEQMTPQAASRDIDAITFRWDNPAAQESFVYTTTVRTKNTYQPVTTAITYPISQPIPNDIQPYLQETPLIDITPQIRQQAQTLAAGKTDLFDVSFTIAEWVTDNIAYDLQTITANASQPASWVYESRYGVCDELSTLYIAMMRSLGVPVRFVSGMSYTNSELFDDPWNAHAWVEVYFFEHGWVPFDLTYRQFGYIDATHIQLKTSVDADEATTSYQWSGRLKGVDIQLQPLDFDMQIVETSAPITEFISVKPSLIRPQVSFGSYSAVQLELENTRSHYVTADFQVSAPQEIEFLEDNTIAVYLRPFEKRIIFVPFKVPSNLKKNYEYTFPFSFYSYNVLVANAELQSKQSYPDYSLTQLEYTMKVRQEAIDTLELECSLVEPVVYVNKPFFIQCETDEQIEICIFDDCQTSGYTFESTFTTVGEKDILISADGKNSIFPLFVSDVAAISVSIPQKEFSLSYDDSFVFSMLLEKESVSQPENVVVKIGDIFPVVYQVGSLATTQNLSTTMFGSSFVYNVNEVPIQITYQDAQKKEYSITDTFTVTLEDVTFWQRIQMWFTRILG